MGLIRGGATPTKIMRGTTAVKKVMRGAVQVWPYPAAGVWGPVALAAGSTTYSSHVFAEAGSYTITHIAYGTNPGLRVRINWSGGFELSGEPSGGSTSATVTRSFALGAVVDFNAFITSGSGDVVRGTWSIVKN